MNRYQTISRPLTEIGDSYGVVVVGSGYGGAIAASRLARAGQTVCVLERGREIAPGQYPNDLASTQADLQVDGKQGRLGPRDGLFDLRLNDDMLALVGCGLGGTSLINANVALEMDPRLFGDPAWPALFRTEPGVLEPYARRARTVLDVQSYPEQAPALNKMRVLQQSAQALRRPFRRAPIAVNFKDQVNPFGVAQPACNNCGDCTSGCNVGAKNTTLMNYLPDACLHGAQVFTGAHITHLERVGTRWRVHFEAVPLRAPAGAPSTTPAGGSVLADIVMLGAGALGSTEILLRSKARGLPLSDRVGRSFSGNGDVLALGYDNYWRTGDAGPHGESTPLPVYGIGAGSNKLQPQQMPGPCITGVIDLRREKNPREGLVIEEGVIPGALASLMPPVLFAAGAMAGGQTQYGASQAATRLEDAQTLGNAVQNNPGSLTGQAYTGPVARTQTYLVMSVDDAGGQLKLVDDRLRIHWPGAGTSPTIARDNRWLAAANEAVQGVFLPNPLWNDALGHKLITVHPLGGCGMGDDAERGVTNADGQVYAGATGTGVHEGLFVCDGSLLPTAAGVNPLLTISALAERCCQRLCDARGWALDLAPPTAPPPPRMADDEAVAPHRVAPVLAQLEHGAEGLLKSALHHLEGGAIDVAHKLLSELIDKHPEWLSPSFQFTERMHGFVSLEADGGGREEDASPTLVSRYELAAAWGRAAGHTMDFELTIRTDDLYRMVNDASHTAAITGQVTCAALSTLPMTVQSGSFRLLPPAPDAVETWTMSYEMVIARPGAAPLRFAGSKWLHQRPGSSPWTDLTTLFVDVEEAGPTPRRVAQGILTLDLEDFIWQANTLSLSPPHDVGGRLEKLLPAAEAAINRAYLAKFAGFFGGTVFNAYGGLLSDLAGATAPSTSSSTPSARRTLRLPGAEVFPLDVGDGVVLRLTRYRAGRKGPLILAAGVAMRASSWAVDTTSESLAEALCAQGYDVWLFDYRGSPDAVGSQQRFNIDDIARIDWPAAVGFVRRATGAESVQVLGHCVGSMSVLMALLGGLQGVRSVVSSQVTLHPLTYWLNQAKADIGLARLLEHGGNLGGLFRPVPGTTQADRELDVMAWSVPVPMGQTCKSAVCKRINAFFGPVVVHEQLNEATHAAMGEMFGPISLSVFDQLTLIMQHGHVVDAQGRNTYLTADNARRMALPISFMSGGLNTLFNPESSLRTEAWLAQHNGPQWYRRRVMEGYGHLDNFVGRHAAREVYPWVLGELERGDAAR